LSELSDTSGDLGIRVLGFAGSARADSYNKKLVQIALRGAGEAGADVTFVDLRDYPLPLYDGDAESTEGLPEHVDALRRIVLKSDALLIASPEYNGFLSPLLKNTIDWLTRSSDGQPDLSAFQNKVAGLMAASPGPLGGLRGLRGVRELMTNLGVIVLPQQLTVRSAMKAFDAEGGMLDASQAGRVEALGAELAVAASRFASGSKNQ
jgi:chromate reductase